MTEQTQEQVGLENIRSAFRKIREFKPENRTAQIYKKRALVQLENSFTNLKTAYMMEFDL